MLEQSRAFVRRKLAHTHQKRLHGVLPPEAIPLSAKRPARKRIWEAEMLLEGGLLAAAIEADEAEAGPLQTSSGCDAVRLQDAAHLFERSHATGALLGKADLEGVVSAPPKAEPAVLLTLLPTTATTLKPKLLIWVLVATASRGRLCLRLVIWDSSGQIVLALECYVGEDSYASAAALKRSSA